MSVCMYACLLPPLVRHLPVECDTAAAAAQQQCRPLGYLTPTADRSIHA